MKKYFKYFIFLTCMCIFSQCEKNDFIDDESAKLQFSTDTVFFDTVFTTIGSSTQFFKIYNPHDKNILISEIYLAGGNSSVFRLNIDGEPTRRIKDKKVGPKDSLYVFVEATVGPNGDSLPIVVKDSVVCITNKNIQDVKLMAWGQDMHYYKRDVIESETWNNDKPYVIYDYLVVDSNEVLTINDGVEVYLHWNSRLYVLGTLIVNGSVENPVIFKHDRLEGFYETKPGQWFAIQLMEGSKGNIINHAIIKNSVYGIWMGWPADQRNIELGLKNTIITNTSADGIISFGAHMNMYNSVISQTGGSSISALRGGSYNFYHCTFVNHIAETPAVFFSNFLNCPEQICEEETIYEQGLEGANFVNSIIYGKNEKTSKIAFVDNENSALNYNFSNCMITLVEDSFEIDDPNLFTDNIFNQNPKLIDENVTELDYEQDFRLDTLSPAKDAGSVQLIRNIPDVLIDLAGKSRLDDNAPDIGAFERIENE